MAKSSPRNMSIWNAASGGDRMSALRRAARVGLEKARGWSLMRNSVFIMGTTIATSGLGYLYWLVAAHAFTAYEVGVASTLISAMILISSLSNLGLGATLI